jgi:polygalacturonase
VYEDSLSYYELLSKVLVKVNELIDKSNEYFGKDLKVYVGEILSSWYDDGTLADIINTDVFNMKVDRTEFTTFKDEMDASFDAFETDVNTQFDTLETELTNQVDQVQDSFKQIMLNVKDLGAKGDSVTDDTLTIQQAIDSLPVDGGTVFFPKGVYRVTSTLKIGSNITLELDKQATIKRSSNMDLFLTNKTDGVPAWNGDHNFKITGGTWDANKSEYQSNCTMFGFIHCLDIDIVDVHFKNLYYWHMIELNACKNVNIVGCSFYNYGGDPQATEMIQLDIASGFGAFPFPGNHIWDSQWCENILIDGCDFTDGVSSIGSHNTAAGKEHRSITITNSRFTGMAKAAITMQNYRDVVIADNRFTDCLVGVYAEMTTFADKDMTNMLVSGNVFSNMKPTNDQGYGIRIVSLTGNKYKNGVISNNTINDVGRHGIGVDYGDGFSIVGNSISNCKQSGIYNLCSVNVVIADNKLTGNTGDWAQADIVLGGTTSGPVTKNCIVKGNILKKLDARYTDKVIITDNIASLGIGVGADALDVKKYNNFIADVWTA